MIDQYIDNERSKVVNDLEFTGCVSVMDLVPRPWVPQNAYNATGDKLRTDGAIAVMQINDCAHPRTTPDTPPATAGRLKRVTRDTVLTIRNDVVRGNVGYQGVDGILWVRYYFETKDQLKPDSGAWRTTDNTGTEFKGSGAAPSEAWQPADSIKKESSAPEKSFDPIAKELEQLHRWDPPHYEIGLYDGYLNYPVPRQEFVTIFAFPKDLNNPDQQFYVSALSNQFKPGWTLGISLTLNTWKWFSNEFSYTYERGGYEYANVFTKPNVVFDEGTSGLVTRQFDYNLLWNLRPRTSRWRPYFAVGPSLILTALADATLKKPAGPFKLGLQNVGLLLAAFETGSTAPLDGGGVFAVGLQFGAGIKYRLLPRLTLSADFRETLSKNPRFITSSYTKEYFLENGYDNYVGRQGLEEHYQQQRFTLGAAFTF